MRQNLFFIVLFLIFVKTHSQNSDFSVDVHYPVPIDNNFIGENFQGIVGLGVDYPFLEFDPIKVGISLNGGLLSEKDDGGQANIGASLKILQPTTFVELNLTPNGKVRPFIGIGYSFLFFKGESRPTFDSPEATTVSFTEKGFNINGGFTFNFMNRFFVKAQYDYIYLAPGETLDIKFNTRVNIFKGGFGLRF